ncbi:hypothetical protein LCGC14_1361860 [marine sediment metagenome]|uniref:Uncharacterized protein n=1 Tax=marine sediment metagenome TaxID=412755 RepID=A0A0F9K7W4_9ZZZZ
MKKYTVVVLDPEHLSISEDPQEATSVHLVEAVNSMSASHRARAKLGYAAEPKRHSCSFHTLAVFPGHLDDAFPGAVVVVDMEEKVEGEALAAVVAYASSEKTTADLKSTPELEIGYKVTLNMEEGLFYPSYEWVRPQKGCGPIPVFTTSAYAFKWLHTLGRPEGKSSKVRRCVYEPSQAASFSQPPSYGKGDSKEFIWIPFYEKTYLNDLFDGTVLADAVMCLED